MESKKIIIPLPNGFRLVAECSPDESCPEIYIGVLGEDDVWYQDLAIVRNAYHYEEDKSKVILDEDKYEVLVFGNENDEDYTESFTIGHYKGGI